MTPAPTRSRRLADWALLVASASGLSLGAVLLVANRAIGNLLDQVLREKGLPSSLTLAILLLALWLACGAAYVLVPSARVDGSERDR